MNAWFILYWTIFFFTLVFQSACPTDVKQSLTKREFLEDAVKNNLKSLRSSSKNISPHNHQYRLDEKDNISRSKVNKGEITFAVNSVKKTKKKTEDESSWNLSKLIKPKKIETKPNSVADSRTIFALGPLLFAHVATLTSIGLAIPLFLLLPVIFIPLILTALILVI